MAFVIVFEEVVQAAVDSAAALTITKIYQGGPPQPHLPEVNWSVIASVLNAAYPGFTQPKTYDANTVSTLAAEMIAHISGETQGLYFATIGAIQDLQAVANQLNALQNAFNSLNSTAARSGGLDALAGQVSVIGAQVNQILQFDAGVLGNIKAIAGADAAAAQNAANAHSNTLYNASVAHANSLAATITGWLKAEEDIRAANDTKVLNAANGHTDHVGATITGWLQAEEKTRAAQDNVLHGEIVNGISEATAAATAAGVAAAAQDVAQLQAKLQPVLDKITTDIDTCLDPLCDTVTPNASQLGRLGSLLKSLEDIGLLGILAALVAEAIVDPQDASSQVIDVAGWVPGVATEIVDAVVG